MVIRRIIGIIMLITALLIVAFSLAGIFYANTVLEELTSSIKSSLLLTTQSLDTASNTIDFVMSTTKDVGDGLNAAVLATGSAAETMADSRPLIENVSGVVTQEIPQAIEGVQGALPNMIQVADVIDNTLDTLSSIGINRDIPLPFGGSFPLRFDLGINYDPEIPFDESLRGFQTSLDGLPESLRGLEDDLGGTAENLTILAADLQLASDNLGVIGAQFDVIDPLFTQYSLLIDQLKETVAQVETDIDRQLTNLRYGAIAVLFFLALTQLAPLYLGWELVTGRRDDVERVLLAHDDGMVYVETGEENLHVAPVTTEVEVPDSVIEVDRTGEDPEMAKDA
jgi:hypothetical protein